MFSPHYGKCTSPSCRRSGQKTLIVVKAGLCDECNYLKKQAAKSGAAAKKELPEKLIKKIENYGQIQKARKKKSKPGKIGKYAKKATGEREMFIEIWQESASKSEIRCESCEIRLPQDEPKVGYFSHILPKSIYGRFRLKKENIAIMCLQCHRDWDFGDRNHPKFDAIRKKAEELKIEYKS